MARTGCSTPQIHAGLVTSLSFIATCCTTSPDLVLIRHSMCPNPLFYFGNNTSLTGMCIIDFKSVMILLDCVIALQHVFNFLKVYCVTSVTLMVY
ncbi:hypothetical protein AALO_G00170990 [Alosa alosa]|uniref:Uncharacterized protein n=1 Tax=Alosa alosa TaxID=278164 RepID=A0AAV6GCU5_9TELE|nr:hypothetical protein AALO_G00170990 [Alosa alosa]